MIHFDRFDVLGIFSLYRWLVRLFDGSDNAKEGWVPASILEAQQMDTAIYGDRVDDAAFRREYVFNLPLEANREIISTAIVILEPLAELIVFMR